MCVWEWVCVYVYMLQMISSFLLQSGAVVSTNVAASEYYAMYSNE